MQSYLYNLQVLRAIAALFVALAHLRSFLYGENIDEIPPQLILGPMADEGGIRLARMGVVLFFVISGFLMERTIRGSKSLTKFGISRFFRLVPLYWLSILIVTLESIMNSTHLHFGNLLSSLTFTSQLAMAQPPINGVGWTLEYEMLFYTLVGLALALPKKKWISLVPGVILVGLMFVGLPPVFIYFLVGQLMFSMLSTKLHKFAVPAILVVSSSFGLSMISSLDPYEIQNMPFFGSLMGVALYLALKLPDLRLQSLETLGNSSYSLYLFHLPIYRFGGSALENTFGMSEFWLGFSLLFLAIGFSVVSWFAIEKRLVSLGRSLSNPTRGYGIRKRDKSP